MKVFWDTFNEKSRKWLMSGLLVTVALVALYVGVIERPHNSKEIVQENATGLAEAPRHALFDYLPRSVPRMEPMMLRAGVSGGGGGGYTRDSLKRVNATLVTRQEQGDEIRKVVRTGEMSLVVNNPRETSEKIRALAERNAGFLENQEIYGTEEHSNAAMTIRVPAERMEQVRAEIRKLGLRVESEKIEAQDVTKEYVDKGARLRNLRAQELQYLGILKQAKTVKDTVDVSEKLDEVRGQIEEQQAEFNALSKQVETVALSISLRAEAEAQVLGLHWRPLYRLKLAMRQGIDGIGDYGSSIASFLFYLPTVILWLATILIGAALGWRLLRWAAKTLFVARPKTA